MTDSPLSPAEDASTQSSFVLSTKLHVPRPPDEYVPRPRLFDRLDRALGAPVTVVCAPPGFGKSTLVAAWCSTQSIGVAWMSADAADADPVRFWRHVAAALDHAVPDVASLVAMVDAHLARDPATPPAELAARINNALVDASDPVVLVIDDYHAVESRDVHASVAFLLDHAPPALRFVLLSRADPPFTLARRRARGELVELREADLRFTRDEAADLLRRVDPGLSSGQLDVLVERTEGWAVGLQLAGLSLAGHPDSASFVAAFSGSHRFVLDFLVEEVLDRQPPYVQEFLLETSILDHLSSDLCDAVTVRTDSQDLLEHAERSGLFLIALDDSRRWWRYHHLFADLLRVQLSKRDPAAAPALHRRAALWHDERELAAEAVRHAVAADDTDLAAEIVQRHAGELLLRFEGASWGWFTELPAELLGSRRLLLAQARLALYDGRPQAADNLLDAADRTHDSSTPGDTTPDELDANTSLLRAAVAHHRGDADEAQARAAEAKEATADPRSTLSLVARLHLAVVPWLRGDVTEAESALLAGIEQWRSNNAEDRAAWTAQYVIDIQRARGDLDAAEQTCRALLDRETTYERPDDLAIAVAHIGLAQVAYERNDIDDARTLVETGIARCRPFIYSQSLATGLATKALILDALGEPAAALEVMDEAVRLGPHGTVADILNPVRAQRARLLLAQGQLDAAAAWIDSRSHGLHETRRHVDLPGDLALADLSLSRGSAAEALPLLDPMRVQAVRQGRWGHLIEIDMLRARALALSGQEDEALGTLDRTIARAAPGGHVRTILAGGTPVADLIAHLISLDDRDRPTGTGAPAQHLHTLEHALTVGPADASPRPQRLVVPLTERELEVLELISTGRRNKDIAAALYVSLNTVKKHVTHIFDKLGVTNRTQATAKARQLRLVIDNTEYHP